ncbi:ferredoxin-thioredoxin reductase catalytic domain-containing protein, partial [Klebsiella pneumoniae]|uniref:ferredoxin-thioredoxin reductase catalytic domain-containing protein n=1 Tax=Klebsiella pneumoniae TaxID=573 RepID=UPI002731C61B
MSAREELRAELEKEMKGRGYYFNPDESFTLDLLEGLLVNEERYGYRACPCRLATGDREKDLDIICPCDY